MIDLHVHSNRSDGTLTPKELVDYAMEKGLSAFALTDHDTVDGLEEALEYAESLKKKAEAAEVSSDDAPTESEFSKRNTVPKRNEVPFVIPGIEFSTEYEGCDIHIVGLDIDYKNPAFSAYLKEFVDSRNNRNRKMCDKLREEAGIDISYDKLLDEFPCAVITRAHYAKYLLNHGYINSMKEAFERYIGDHCPYFIPREKVSPEMAVELILNAGGIPILAHPILYHMSDSRLDTLVCRLKEAGLIGIEAIYSTYNASEERQIRTLAQKYHLILSGGSDFHGANKPGLDLGIGYGNLYVPDEIWDNLKKSTCNLLFCDLDGTLLRDDCTISPAMKEALNHMTAAGHQLILSSGRPLPSILEVREQAGITYPNMLISSYNGALVYDCDNQKPILEYRLSGADVALIVSKAKEAGIHIHGYTASEIVCYGMNEELQYYTSRIHMPLKCVDDLAAALSMGSTKLQTIHLTDKSVLERFREELLSDDGLKERVQIVFSGSHYMEILPIEAGKGTALRFVTDYLPILRTHTYAAGDAQNDISMIEAAHIGIAMANASDDVKQAADIVTKKTNNEDGLLEIIGSIIR